MHTHNRSITTGTTGPDEPVLTPRSTKSTGSRLLRHYLPLCVASVAALVMLMKVPGFDTNRYPPPPDIFTEGVRGAFPTGNYPPRGPAGGSRHERRAPVEQQDGGEAPAPDGANNSDNSNNSTDSTNPSGPGGDHSGPPTGGHGPARHSATTTPESAGTQNGSSSGNHGAGATGDSIRLLRRYSTATGYVALVLLAVTLLIGPANLALRRRNPISGYLRRDIGIWTAVLSAVHVVFGFLVKHGDGQILGYFLEGGARTRILTNSFGLANWAGLASLILVAGLAAISSDAALRKLKAKRWKRYQRSAYLLFALVILHSILYGALWRITSPYTVLLGIAFVIVLAGQLIGIRLWRQRNQRDPAAAHASSRRGR